MLNLPQFEEQPPVRSHGNPPAAATHGPAGTPVNMSQAAAGTGESDPALVANLQFNSPLNLYSGENVVEALQGQTGGQISSVVGYL